MELVAATQPAQIEQVRLLFQEYWDSFDFTPCFQNFSAELAALPGDYAPPRGALALALVGARPAGCAALRPIDSLRCEAKRLYVRPEFRAHGLGKALLDWIIASARARGYRELLGDTMPKMARALAMYDRMGFERIPPYTANPTPGAIYLRLALTP
jgi:GNAT superfamily N-acetyltransferase